MTVLQPSSTNGTSASTAATAAGEEGGGGGTTSASTSDAVNRATTPAAAESDDRVSPAPKEEASDKTEKKPDVAGDGDGVVDKGGAREADDDEEDEEEDKEVVNVADLLAAYPVAKLNKLEELISNPRWVIPVMPKAELEVLLEASIVLAKHNVDSQSDACQRFYREGLLVSFQKIMTDEAVSTWRFDIQHCILQNCERLIELCIVKMDDEFFPLLDLLAIVLNPGNKFHVYNAPRPSEAKFEEPFEPFAKSVDARHPRGWLVDLLNRFGYLGGFERLTKRLNNETALTVPVIHALVRPFGFCHELLTPATLKTWLYPIIESVPKYLGNMSDDDLKKETKTEAKNDTLSTIVKALKNMMASATGVPNQLETVRQLEMFRLKMILRQLQVSSFGGKMNALNEVNRVITSVSYYPTSRHSGGSVGSGSGVTGGGGGVVQSGADDEDYLTADRMAGWLKENKVLQIVLQDSLHQPQYVEKLEKVIRFIIKEKTLTLSDLDDIWAAQVGQHEAIVKNVHDLLAKLAWDFSPEQLDHLFDCFQRQLSEATTKQREKLLELIRRLAEDDKDGVMAEKVLTMFWNLAHNPDTGIDLMDQALAAHVKILDYSCTQYRESQKTRWLERGIEELKNSKNWVLPALKQIRDICCLYQESPPNVSAPGPHGGGQRTPGVLYRHEVINKLQTSHALVILVADNLTNYIDEVRQSPNKILESEPLDYHPDGRYNHVQQVQERLSFLRFLLKDGQLWLCAPQAKQIWNCLAENAVFPHDREACFKWFSKLMGEEPDLDPEINREFFENNILQLDPSLMTESGIRCFDRFFKAVNSKENKLIPKRRAFLMDDLELIGLDYIWRLVLCSNEDIAIRAIDLLKETFTNLGPRLQANQVDIHEDFISSCMDRLKASYDTVTVLEKDKDSPGKLSQELTRLCRVLKVLQEYVMECDADFLEERTMIPLFRAPRGKQIGLVVRFPNQQTGGRQQTEDIEIWTHTNETLAALRRQILQRHKVSPSNVKVELFLNGDVVDSCEDRKILGNTCIKDKSLLTGKLSQIGGNLVSSPDSSSDSSTSSPRHQYDGGSGGGMGGPNVELEQCLPGAIMSAQKNYCQFLLQLADLGCTLNHTALQERARSLLKLIPADAHSMDRLRTQCSENHNSKRSPAQIWENVFFSSSPSQTLYNLEVCYSMLMPGSGPLGEKTFDFQQSFIRAKGIPAMIGMLTRNNFLAGADLATKQAAYVTLLRMCKLLFSVAGHSLVHMVAEACQPDSPSSVTPHVHNQAVVLQQALHQIPSPLQEAVVRSVSGRLAPQLLEVGASHLPDQATVTAIIRVAWAAGGGGRLANMNSPAEELHERFETAAEEPDEEDVSLCREALEVLSLAIALSPSCLETLSKDQSWHKFIIDLVLLSKVRNIRQTAADQFILIATKCSGDQQPLRFFTTLLFTVLNSLVPANAAQCSEYFYLLYRLLAFTSSSSIPLNTAEILLNTEIQWLKKVKETVRKTGVTGYHDNLLEGHLCVCRELLAFMSAEKKFEIGSSGKSGINLARDLIDDFVFPASRMMVTFRQTGEVPMTQVVPVCSSPQTVMAAFDLIVGLCTGCSQNLKLVAQILCEMFYADKEDALTEWEYLPPIGPRPANSFVGLKNAGATCYMNSVLQQLFMVEAIREGVLSADGACNVPDEDFSGDDRDDDVSGSSTEADVIVDDKQNRKEYNITILKQVQAIFAHLAKTKLQFYVPRGLWKHFRMLEGEPVNLREQQDAVEFFLRLIDLVDEALKALGFEQKLTKVLSGVYSDQKICKTCPHRYSKEQPFTVVNVDIKNFNNLQDSLQEYCKGELLDGSNAYYCERCDKKVDTIKRLCIKRLPKILVIQLKRFDYDYERECAIKFNDYFEFPRELDMAPYTVAGLSKIEGEAIDFDQSDLDNTDTTEYTLRGMVVHSGQASGGHYYSYIRHDSTWYKFDDGDVNEIKIEDEEELKAQCYGGEYMSEVFDPMLKRMSYRKQKRWWNAYMLFYTRCDVGGGADESEKAAAGTSKESSKELAKAMAEMTIEEQARKVQKLKVPVPIERSIQKQNIKFLHVRNQYSSEFFTFMKKLVNCNGPYVTPTTASSSSTVTATTSGTAVGAAATAEKQQLSPEGEELAMITMQLASKFLFSSGFRTKKTLRGPAQEWYEILTQHFRHSRQVRLWFCQKALFAHPSRFCEYILECPSAEVRTAFVRIIVFVAHFSLNDGPAPVPPMLQQTLKQSAAAASSGENPPVVPGTTLSDHLLQTVLALLWMEVSEHGRHLPQYFSLFVMYASLGGAEKTQLLRLNVPATFIQVALDEGPGPPIKYQYAELAKLYQVVSQLVRCCDVSSKCQSAVEGKAIMPNPFLDASCPTASNEGGTGTHYVPLYTLQPAVGQHLYDRYSYLKKLIEEANGQEDTKKLLQFCSWENPTFSHAVLHELLWQIAIAYTHELRPYLDLLFHILMMQDSWQSIRIQKSLRGIPDDHSAREGLFDTISRSKTHYQKRAYQCVKLLVNLFGQCPAAKQLLDNNVDIKRKWSWAVEWLSDELDRGRGQGGTSASHGQGQGSHGTGGAGTTTGGGTTGGGTSGGTGGSGSGVSGQYSYSNWSPPAQSNESVNGYFLERSHSARLTLEKACDLLPDEEELAETSSTGGGLEVSDVANSTSTSGTGTTAFGGDTTGGSAESPPLTKQPETKEDTSGGGGGGGGGTEPSK